MTVYNYFEDYSQKCKKHLILFENYEDFEKITMY